MAEPLRRFLRSLNEGGVEYAVVGAHAVAYHGYPRATRDLDILYLQAEDNVRRLAACVAERVPGVSPEDLMGPADEFAILRFMGERVDLLPEIAGVSTPEALRRAVPGVLFGEPTRFIAKQDLIANKRSTGRDRDRVDADAIDDP
ncbi:MAG: hypothetical protein ACODAU_04410 [Myxococcota bacterium]